MGSAARSTSTHRGVRYRRSRETGVRHGGRIVTSRDLGSRGPVGGSSHQIHLVSYASFILIGWTGLFVPSLLRVLQDDFARSDAEFGLVYLVGAVISVSYTHLTLP